VRLTFAKNFSLRPKFGFKTKTKTEFFSLADVVGLRQLKSQRNMTSATVYIPNIKTHNFKLKQNTSQYNTILSYSWSVRCDNGR